jgi:hypothetical protein
MRRSIRHIFTAALLVMAAGAPVAHAAAPETVLQDDALLLHGGDQGVHDAMARLRDLGVDRVRLTAGWSVIAPQPDAGATPAFDATDPAAYPAGAWMNLDRAVREAQAAGLGVMIDIAFWAPRWATQDDPTASTRLRTAIDPAAYARFAQAVATRYSGDYRPTAVVGEAPAAPPPSPDGNLLQQLFSGGQQNQPAPAAGKAQPAEPLPAVDVFTVWNEPNHPGFVSPQWERRDGAWWPASADIYRAMVRAAYPAIKAGAPRSTVLIGATSSMGSSEPGRSGVPPLRFIRALACVDARWQPLTTGTCAGYTTLPGDGWSHHPYSLRTLPEARPLNPDKLPVASTPRLLGALRLLVREGRFAAGTDNLWMTEYGYETNPPDPQAMFGLEAQADLLARAERIATADPGVRSWPQFLLRDRPGGPAGPALRDFGDWQTGLEDAKGVPKPAYGAFRMPAVALCQRQGTRLLVWARWRGVPGATARVQRRSASGAWADSGPSLAAAATSAAVSTVTAWKGGASARLHWTAADGRTGDTRELTPVPCGIRSARAARHPQNRGGRHRKLRRAVAGKRGRGQRSSGRIHPARRSR